MPNENELYRVLDWAQAGAAEGSRYPGMSYEDGVMSAIEWMLGRGPAPDEDD